MARLPASLLCRQYHWLTSEGLTVPGPGLGCFPLLAIPIALPQPLPGCIGVVCFWGSSLRLLPGRDPVLSGPCPRGPVGDVAHWVEARPCAGAPLEGAVLLSVGCWRLPECCPHWFIRARWRGLSLAPGLVRKPGPAPLASRWPWALRQVILHLPGLSS